MEISSKNNLYLILKLGVVLIFLLDMENAKADDIYNFHFQKSQKEKPKETQQVEEGFRPNTHLSQATSKEKPKNDYKKWEINAGPGYVFGSAQVFTIDANMIRWNTTTSYTQKLYVVGGKYNLNRFFDAHGALHLPNGNMDRGYSQVNYQNGSSSTEAESTLDFQLMLGMGTTPFHFDFLGFNFLELGWDVSVVLGDENYLGGNSSVLLWGPRAVINFSNSISLLASVQREIERSGGSNFGVTSVRLGYRW